MEKRFVNTIPMPTTSWLALIVSLVVTAQGCTQPADDPADLLITNARIFTAAGATIERGYILIRDGRLEAVGPGDSTAAALGVIDADGATALPGLMDVHRHFLTYSQATNADELRHYIETDLVEILEGLLAGGLTTVMSPGDAIPEMVEVAQRVANGELVGPRLLIAGPVFTAPGDHPAEGPVCRGEPYCRKRLTVEVADPSTARAKVREVVQMGADFIKVVIDRTIVPNITIDEVVFEAIAAEAEAEALSVPLIVHVLTVEDMVRAVEMGADKLVHTPSLGSVEAAGAAEILKQSGVPIATTVSWTSPEVGADFGGGSAAREKSHKQTLENIRYLKDQGVVVAFGTDNPPPLGLTEFLVEAKALGTVLSPSEVIETMTINAAAYLGIDDRVGSLEAGKIADLVIVDGNPLEDVSALANVAVVVVEGRIAFDRR
jgi:imidazolonepropionase-like amidohydrolase